MLSISISENSPLAQYKNISECTSTIEIQSRELNEVGRKWQETKSFVMQ